MDVNIENVDGNNCDTIIQFNVLQSAGTNEQTLVIKHAPIDYQLDSIRTITLNVRFDANLYRSVVMIEFYDRFCLYWCLFR